MHNLYYGGAWHQWRASGKARSATVCVCVCVKIYDRCISAEAARCQLELDAEYFTQPVFPAATEPVDIIS